MVAVALIAMSILIILGEVVVYLSKFVRLFCIGAFTKIVEILCFFENISNGQVLGDCQLILVPILLVMAGELVKQVAQLERPGLHALIFRVGA